MRTHLDQTITALPLVHVPARRPAPRWQDPDRAWRVRYLLVPGLASGLVGVALLLSMCLGEPAYRMSELNQVAPRLAQLPQPVAPGLRPDTAAERASQAEERPRRPRLSLAQRQRLYWPLVRRLARRHGLDPALIMAVIQVESHFLPDATSPKGAVGLMQIVPNTAEHLGVSNLWDPETNLEAGVRYLAQLKRRFKGDMVMALAAYNAGPTKVQDLGRVPDHEETRNYVIKVLSLTDVFRQRFQSLARN